MIGQGIFIIILYLILGIFEIQFPAEQNQGFRGRTRNIFYTIIILTVGAVATALMYRFIDSIIPFQPRELVDHGIWFSVMITVIYVFLTDLIFYWYHRAEHVYHALWQIHELHHSDVALNATTSMRTYWLERPIQTLLISIPITYIVGIDERAMVAFPVILMIWLFFTHANIRLRLGFLTPIICGPQYHRIHHSILPEHQDKNFAQYFPVLDYLFGTHYHPGKDEFPPTGTAHMGTDEPIMHVMRKPFATWVKKI